MKLLENKVAVITGGSRGIGAEIVRKFAAQGADIAFTYRSSTTQAEALIEELKDLGVRIKAYASDASSFDATQDLMKEILKDFGRVDILVNNAGITRDNLLMRMSEEQWDMVMDNNLKSVFNFCKSVMRPMLKARAGSIINMSSIIGLRGNAGQANYAASKAGIIGFTQSLAQEMGSRNIRCNVIAPGYIQTEMTAELDEKIKDQLMSKISLNRLGTTEDIANAALYLASDLSSYVTGEVLNVSGGM